MFETLQSNIFPSAPHFSVYDQTDCLQSLESLMGTNGLILGFTSEIWRSASVRRILWLHRHANRLHSLGVNVALAVCDEQHTLYGFYMSSPATLTFPLLADTDQHMHQVFSIAQQGMILIDRQNYIRHRWLMSPDRVWPSAPEIASAIHTIL